MTHRLFLLIALAAAAAAATELIRICRESAQRSVLICASFRAVTSGHVSLRSCLLSCMQVCLPDEVLGFRLLDF